MSGSWSLLVLVGDTTLCATVTVWNGFLFSIRIISFFKILVLSGSHTYDIFWRTCRLDIEICYPWIFSTGISRWCPSSPSREWARWPSFISTSIVWAPRRRFCRTGLAKRAWLVKQPVHPADTPTYRRIWRAFIAYVSVCLSRVCLHKEVGRERRERRYQRQLTPRHSI